MQKTKSSQDTLKKYLSLMRDIRRREEVIIEFYNGTCNAKFQIVNCEIMYFQLRKILEIIAKSPMLVYENEYRSISNNPSNDWRIKEIMTKLFKINPDFYPTPIEIIKHNNNIDEFITLKNGYLTQDELIDAYNLCNSFLHSENPLSIESSFDFEEEWIKIVGIINKIHKLLNFHLAKPLTEDSFYYISMDNNAGIPFGCVFLEKLKN